MRVYRLETDDNRGIYRSGIASLVCNGAYPDLDYDMAYDTYRHPTPWADTKLAQHLTGCGGEIPPEYRFGFSSMEQYRSWFYSDKLLEAFAEHGICLSIYEVPECYVIDGNAQALFVYDQAILKHRIAPLDPEPK